MTGQDFRLTRRSLGMSQERLAEVFEVERKTIIRIEARETVPKVYQLALEWLGQAAVETRAAA